MASKMSFAAEAASLRRFKRKNILKKIYKNEYLRPR